ncbi:MAG: sigma-54 dependent transcriptional regulator [Bryobacteraceae bacterium]|jgi:DNA-binding NtrC family response regulator
MTQGALLIIGKDSPDGEGRLTDTDWQELLPGYSIRSLASLSEAQAAFEAEEIDCVLVLDPAAGEDPIDILEAIHSLNSTLPVVFRRSDMTAFTAARLIYAGAAHCFDSRDSIGSLREMLETAISQKRMQDRSRQAAARCPEPWRAFLIGESRAMEAVAETVRLVGPRRCTVLISGETGTGKEMAARAIHMASPRSRHPMVAINCSALPENLLEAELFGHTKGAFTGAANLRIGRFEQAHQSTIFLDEIGDMPLELQAKLLRVLQDREVQRLGSSENIKIDVRVIAATNVDLEERVKQGRFRADLFYRLNVVPLRMPPLSKRTTDIPALVNHFIRKVCNGENIPLKRLSPEALCRICANPWPGNVRQLENMVEMAVAISGDRDVLHPRDFGLTDSGPRSTSAGAVAQFPPSLSGPIHFDTAVSQFQLAILDAALRQSNGNKTVAAQRLGIKRTTLIMKMRSLENSGYLQKVG